MQQEQQQSFNLADLTGADIEAMMNALGEQPSKLTRLTMNKIEGQVIQQILAAQSLAKAKQAKGGEDFGPVDPPKE